MNFKPNYLAFALIGCCFVAAAAVPGTSSQSKLPSKYVTEIDGLKQAYEARFATGQSTKFDVDQVERLANRAHYMNGDIARADFLKRSDEITDEMNRAVDNGSAAGALPNFAEMRKTICEGVAADYALP